MIANSSGEYGLRSGYFVGSVRADPNAGVPGACDARQLYLGACVNRWNM